MIPPRSGKTRAARHSAEWLLVIRARARARWSVRVPRLPAFYSRFTIPLPSSLPFFFPFLSSHMWLRERPSRRPRRCRASHDASAFRSRSLFGISSNLSRGNNSAAQEIIRPSCVSIENRTCVFPLPHNQSFPRPWRTRHANAGNF